MITKSDCIYQDIFNNINVKIQTEVRLFSLFSLATVDTANTQDKTLSDDKQPPWSMNAPILKMKICRRLFIL